MLIFSALRICCSPWGKGSGFMAILTQVCRAAGYYGHALAVAQAAHEPEWALDILLEDCAQYDEALDFLRTLPRQQAAAAITRHGKVQMRSHGQRPFSKGIILHRHWPGPSTGCHTPETMPGLRQVRCLIRRSTSCARCRRHHSPWQGVHLQVYSP